MTAIGTSYWRVAGLSYLKYVQVSSSVVRSCLKDRSAAVIAREELLFKERKWEAGKPTTDKFTVSSTEAKSPLLEAAE
eukprot:snap_masked-scaffold_49-processed-gene-0.14-mRNA-1 protein AED:0.51 eAED:0.51 QI:0/-1/0/1/-1/1/1/0/77